MDNRVAIIKNMLKYGRVTRVNSNYFYMDTLVDTLIKCGYKVVFIMQDAIEREVETIEVDEIGKRLSYSFTDPHTGKKEIRITRNRDAYKEIYLSKIHGSDDNLLIESRSLTITLKRETGVI